MTVQYRVASCSINSAAPLMVHAKALESTSWIAETGIPNPGAGVNSVHYSPDGAFLAWGGDTTPAFGILTAEEKQPLVGLPAVAGNVDSLCWSPDGRQLAIAHTAAPYLTILETDTWSALFTGGVIKAPFKLRFSPDSQRLLIAFSATPYRQLLEMGSWTLTTISDGESIAHWGSDWRPDGAYFAMANARSNVAIGIYDAATLTRVTPSEYPGGYGYDCAFSHDGTLLAVAHGSAPYVTFYETATWTRVNSGFSSNTRVNTLDFTPDDAYLVLGRESYDRLVVMAVADGSVTVPADAPTYPVDEVSVSPQTDLSYLIKGTILVEGAAPGVAADVIANTRVHVRRYYQGAFPPVNPTRFELVPDPASGAFSLALPPSMQYYVECFPPEGYPPLLHGPYTPAQET